MSWPKASDYNAAIQNPRASFSDPELRQGLAAGLREAGMAHADLQHGNVLLIPGSKDNALALRLVDYDGMYVPALADRPSGELGHPNYQHPLRVDQAGYNPGVDRFSHLVI